MPTGPTLTAADDDTRKRLFGEFDFRGTGQGAKIEILGDWVSRNIVRVELPGLASIPLWNDTLPSPDHMRFHRNAAGQLQALWTAWREADLLTRILTYDGSFYPRFVRGAPGRLSSHAYGSAFDINARWNPLNQTPASQDSEGSVRELVDIANRHGFFWGGHFPHRLDGMHFEIARLQPPPT